MYRVLFLFLFFVALAMPAHAADADAEANKLFVEAVQLTHRADTTYDTKESVRLLRGANQLLKKIVANYPQSAIAVQLSTHQLIGDFDITEFEGRIRSLSCARGSYVEDFLSEYGIASGTGPLTEACFLYRMENLLNLPEPPIVQARSDWLSLAVAYNLSGQEERARGIVLPYLGILRKNTGGGVVAPDAYLVLARALALTGADVQAQQVADHISDCSSRLSYMLTTLNIALAHDDDDSKTIAEQIRREADANSCEGQQGAVVQALMLVGRTDDAKALYEKINTRHGEDASSPPPELAIAAAMLDDSAQALALTRASMEHEPGVVTAVIAQLAKRGEFQAAHDLTADMHDSVRKASALAALIVGGAPKADAKQLENWMSELRSLRNDAPQLSDQVAVLGATARAEKALYKDDRWKNSFQLALNAAERADESIRGALVVSLATQLAAIKAGRAVLD